VEVPAEDLWIRLARSREQGQTYFDTRTATIRPCELLRYASHHRHKLRTEIMSLEQRDLVKAPGQSHRCR
jgi:hypothetical protein